MFFKKKKAKLDPKVRFQNRQFNQKLQQARTFKRVVKPVPEGEFSKFLKSVGLDSPWRQIGLALFVLAILYIVYFPNFLSLKHIQIEGVKESDRAVIEADLRDNISRAPFYNPQRNLLFLSSNRVLGVVKSNNLVYSVDSFSRDFRHQSIKIVITPKQEKYLVRSNDKVFKVYNDGTLQNDLGGDRSLWDNNPNLHLIRLDIPAVITSQNNQFLTNSAVDYIDVLTKELKNINGSPLAYINLPLTEVRKVQKPEIERVTDLNQPASTTTSNNVNVNAQLDAVDKLISEESSNNDQLVQIHTPISIDELNLFFQKGDQKDKLFKVLLDPTENPKEVVGRLNLLLSQTQADRYANLNYIDLRIKNRAFICVFNTPCAN